MPEPHCRVCGHTSRQHPLRRWWNAVKGQEESSTACRAAVGEERCDCPEYEEANH